GAAAETKTPKKGAKETAKVAEPEFDLERVAKRARKLAAGPSRDPKGDGPDWLLGISYDQWRDIRFRTDRALSVDGPSPFQVQFFHPGRFYDRRGAVQRGR